MDDYIYNRAKDSSFFLIKDLSFTKVLKKPTPTQKHIFGMRGKNTVKTF